MSLSPSSRRSTPKRHPLHERTKSQNNVIRPISPTLRLVSNRCHEDSDEDDFNFSDRADVYSANPYPTKPAHVLLPPGSTPRGRQSRAGSPSTTISDRWASRASLSPQLGPPSPGHTHTSGSVSDLSTFVGNTSSAIWGQDPKSSNTTIDHSETPRAVDSGDSGNDDEEEDSSDHSSLTALPKPPAAATIKLVNQGERSDQSRPIRTPPSDGSLIVGCSITRGHSSSSNGSSNVARIGYTSSPNLVPLNSSSPNLLPIGSSPNIVRARASESSLFSANSFGTAIRYLRNRREQTSASESASINRYGSQTSSIPSSPPVPVLRSYQSTSTLELNAVSSNGSQGSGSLPSMPSDSDLRAVLNSGVTLQYPSLRPASSSSSFAETSMVSIPEPLALHRPPTRRWNPHLSTVSSELSMPMDEHHLPSLSLDGNPADRSQPDSDVDQSWLSTNQPGMPNHSMMDELERDEVSDRITQLHALRVLKHKTSATLSYRSSISKHGSLSRSGSTASCIITNIPQWAKIYYQGGSYAFLSAISLVDVSRPTTPRDIHAVAQVSYSEPLEEFSNQAIVRAPPANISRPRTRPRRESRSVQRQANPPPQTVQEIEGEDEAQAQAQTEVHAEPQPRSPQPTKPRDTRRASLDPRTHWAGIVGEDEISAHPSREETPRGVWSPHLYTDKRFQTEDRKFWRAPQYDDSDEPTWSRRNLQIISFCIGFIFPLAWLIAAFFPLPAKPLSLDEESAGKQPEVERAAAHRAGLLDTLRFENARWWRNLNRCMAPVGLSIVVIVITLSVLGSRNAL